MSGLRIDESLPISEGSSLQNGPTENRKDSMIRINEQREGNTIAR